MRVLMLGWEFPPHISGGLGTACRGIVRGLAQRGVDVTFVVPRAFGDEEADGVEVIGLSRAHAGSPVSGAARAQPIRRVALTSSLRPYEDARAYAERTERSTDGFEGGYGRTLHEEVERYASLASELVRGRAFDVVHAHDWMTWPAALGIRAHSHKPLVCHVHATEFDRSLRGGDARVRELEARGLSAADRAVCVSRRTADVVRRAYGVDPARLRVVHNAAPEDPEPDEDVVPRRRRAHLPVVLFLGRITPQKGPDIFLEAARRVLAQLPGTRFVMAGDGESLPRSIEHAAELGLARAVRFTGFLEPAGVAHVYGQADVFVLSSVSEPFGLTPLEALRHGVPVIVSRQSGVAEVLPSVLRFDFWNVDELARKIVELLTRPGLRRRMARVGREEALRLRWEDRADELIQIYRELIG
jgi:glycosyltransferase involved in cell wall biosynthesis